MLGLGPIRRATIGYFHDITSDYEEAKKMAVNEYLSIYLQLNEDNISDFEVLDKMHSKSDEDILYVTFRNHESIKEIHKRVAEVKNDDISIRNYIPPQFWSRYWFLSQYCTELRSNDKNLKTLIRFQ